MKYSIETIEKFISDRGYTITDGTVKLSAACGRCGGHGRGPWFPDGGICYDCRGAVTVNTFRNEPIRKLATKIRRQEKIQAEKLAEQKIAAAKHEENCARAAKKFEAEQAIRRESSNHFGTVGDRIEIDVTLEKVISGEGAYGTWYLSIMKTASGDAVIWWNSLAIAEGESVRIRATIKAHDERDDVKQTVIARAKVIA